MTDLSDLFDSFCGVWELDPTTLAYEHGRPGRRAIYTIVKAAEGLEFTLDAEDADGKPMHFTYGGKLDGFDRPYPGSPVTVAMTLLEDGRIESVAKKNGVVVDRWTREAINGGKALLICQHGMTAAGKEVLNSGVYRKIG
jgi:hypothetical protein